MGLTIFYSLSVPANVLEEDILNRLSLLQTKAKGLVAEGFPKGQVGRLSSLNHDELVVAQADPNCEVFPFALQSARPIGARGCKPEIGVGFRVQLLPTMEVWFGLCRYPAGSPILIEWRTDEAVKYAGQWFFYNYIDPIGKEDRRFVRSLLEAAKNHGFSVQVRDEAGEAF